MRFASLIIISSLFLTGCISSPPKLDANPQTLAGIKSIAVIRAPEIQEYTVLNLGHPGMAFGLIGGLIAEGDMASKQKELTTALKKLDIVPAYSKLADDIAGQLENYGYTVKVEEGPWHKDKDQVKIEYTDIKSDAEIVLVVMPTIVGFVSSGLMGDYVPSLTASVILLGKDRKEELYRGFHAYGWKPVVDGWRFTSAKRSFGNFDDLMKDPSVTAESLTEAANAIAVTIGEDLKR